MCFGKIGHVSVIANRRAVRCGVIRPENSQRLSAHSRVDRQRDQVRFWIMMLAQLAAWVGPCRVEVAKTGEAQAISGPIPSQNLFEEQLGFRVRAQRVSRTVLADGQGVLDTIDRATGRKYYTSHAGIDENVEEVNRI